METVVNRNDLDEPNNVQYHHIPGLNRFGNKSSALKGEMEPQSPQFQIFGFPWQHFPTFMNFGSSTSKGLPLCQISSF